MTDFAAALDALIASAERDLQMALGGETACVLHRDGRVTGGMKYHEGRLVALVEARRLVRRTDASLIHSELEALHHRWVDEFDIRRSSSVNSPPWVAYATGGVDGAAEAIAEAGRSAE